ncbi:MAG: hypothetical protein ACK4QP_23250 [Pseudorhizobium sp.]
MSARRRFNPTALHCRSFFGPMMLDRPGEGWRVRGELFDIDAGVFRFSTNSKTWVRRAASEALSMSRRSVAENRFGPSVS